MGDVGSTFLGAILVAHLFQGNNIIEFSNILLLNLPLIADSLICLLIRYKKGDNIFLPHKLHLYQRLVLNNFNHSKVALIYILATTYLALLYYFSNLSSMIYFTIFLFFIGIYLYKKYSKGI